VISSQLQKLGWNSISGVAVRKLQVSRLQRPQKVQDETYSK
jgi:hypothetical protein